jgi:isopenicillin N synthase-like dioxygenase
MEQYFKTTSEKFYNGQQLIDCKPEFNFQAGVTTERVEKARNHQQLLKQIPTEDLPLSKFPPEFDAKWRFFWAIGERPAEVANDIPKIIPTEFPEWEAKMNRWGEMMMEACMTAAQMAAIGMGVKQDTFTSIMEGGPHLLSPTGSDL